jgi:hypothetical protein
VKDGIASLKETMSRDFLGKNISQGWLIYLRTFSSYCYPSLMIDDNSWRLVSGVVDQKEPKASADGGMFWEEKRHKLRINQ